MNRPERQQDERYRMTIATSAELDDLVETLVQGIRDAGGEMPLSDLIDFPDKRKGIELSEVAAILERARNLGKIGMKDVLATIYIPVAS